VTTTSTATQKSTIVRTKNHKLMLTRAAFQVLDRIAPDRAGRWALDIWCTLPANAGRRRDERPYAGQVSTAELPGGRRMVVESWGEGPTVYLVHGWGGWRGQLGAFVAPLVAAGHRVVAFDAPSHGDSGPGLLGAGKSLGPELADAVRAVVDQHGAPSAIVAHSLGCVTTALALSDGMARPDQMIFVSPSPDPVSAIGLLRQALGFGDRTAAKLLARLEERAGRPLADFDVDAKGSADLPPTLVIHDRSDKEVPYSNSVRLTQAWPTAELVSTDGLGHQRILRDPDVVQLVVRTVVAQPQPTGTSSR
jgi:pimeloyl-ACP methyl ester carboxylesterase